MRLHCYTRKLQNIAILTDGSQLDILVSFQMMCYAGCASSLIFEFFFYNFFFYDELLDDDVLSVRAESLLK